MHAIVGTRGGLYLAKTAQPIPIAVCRAGGYIQWSCNWGREDTGNCQAVVGRTSGTGEHVFSNDRLTQSLHTKYGTKAQFEGIR
jgi:hypothetical protein